MQPTLKSESKSNKPKFLSALFIWVCFSKISVSKPLDLSRRRISKACDNDSIITWQIK